MDQSTSNRGLKTTRKRIAEEMDAKTGVLDLSGLELTALPPELFGEGWTADRNLEHLRELHFGKQEEATVYQDPDYQFHELEREAFPASASDWAPLKNLETLSLSSIPPASRKWPEKGRYAGPASLPPLPGRLRTLELRHCKNLTELGPVSELTSLQSLDLTGCDALEDLSALHGLTALTKLNLAYCKQVSDFSPLAELTALKLLDLTECEKLDDLGNLRELQSLERLDLCWDSEITNLEPLAGMTALKWLDLKFCNRINDLTPLRELTSLTYLNLERLERVKDLGPLSGLQVLETLDLSHCRRIRSLEPLTGMTRLEKLNLQKCWGVDDLSPLAGMKRLRELNLRGCYAVSDLTPLDALEDLEPVEVGSGELTLSGWDVQNLGVLPHPESLRELTLKDGSLDRLQLENMPNLRRMHVTGCGRLVEVNLEHLESLAELQLDLYPWDGWPHPPLSLESFGGIVSPPEYPDRTIQIRLADLPALETVEMCCHGTKIAFDLNGLDRLRSLTMLRVGPSSDLRFLSALPKLRLLEIDGEQCLSMSMDRLTPLVRLEELTLNRVSDADESFADVLPKLVSLKRLCLFDIELPEVPGELLSKDRSDNCLERLRAFYEER